MSYKHFKANDPNIINLYGVRTAETSCGYLVPHISPSANILDVGCGPGRITADLAKLASQGQTIGVDASVAVIAEASASFPSSEIPNLKFVVGDATKLAEYMDNSFDIVHCHQLLVHVTDAQTAMKEFYRICKPGGIVACREVNFKNVVSLKPDLPELRAFFSRTAETIGGHADAGDMLETWAKGAGFGSDGGKGVVLTKNVMQSPSMLSVVTGAQAESAVAFGMASKEEMDVWAKAWEQWEKTEGKEYTKEMKEILCFKGDV